MSAESYIERVERTVQGLLREVEELPADVLYREPSAGEWPVMSTLAHLAELLPYWAHQAAAVADSPGSTFGRTHEDPVRLGAIEQHGQDSLSAIVPSIRAALTECIETLRAIPADAWSAVGHSPTRGSKTVSEIVEAYLAHHAEEHATQVQATLETLRTAQRH